MSLGLVDWFSRFRLALDRHMSEQNRIRLVPQDSHLAGFATIGIWQWGKVSSWHGECHGLRCGPSRLFPGAGRRSRPRDTMPEVNGWETKFGARGPTGGIALKQQIAYWTATTLLALAYLAGGYYDITQPEEVVQAAAALGYPLYFFTILGCWKLGAAVAILFPALPRLKEWAYAGIFFNLTGAIASHLFVRDPIGNTVAPFLLLAIAIASWALRPADRRLLGPWL